MFVVIEGVEGSGKSTLLAKLGERLRSEGHDVTVTREPGGTPVGDAIRRVFLDFALVIQPLTEGFLVNAARAQHVSEVIRPALALGSIVLCDRYTDSTVAYQGYGREGDLRLLRLLCESAIGGLQPDLVLLLDLPVNVARARLRERSRSLDRIESEGEGFHERVRQGFLALAESSPHHRVLDATLPQQRLLEKALREVHARLKAKAP
jgi:dTMP kinase